MARNPTVSVIMAAYNHESYIAASVRSVLEQSYDDFEFIVCDDDSTDDTYQLLANFSNDPRLRILRHEKNRGSAAALNSCLGVAVGDYVAVIDSDDIWAAGKLSRQVEFLSTHSEISCVYSRAQIINEEGVRIRETRHLHCDDWSALDSRGRWLRFLFQNYWIPVCHSSFLGARDSINRVGGYDVRFNRGYDYYFLLKLLSIVEVWFIAEPLVEYRVHASNLSRPSEKDVRIRAYGKNIAYMEYLDNPGIKQLWPEIFPDCARFAAELAKRGISEKDDDVMMLLILLKFTHHRRSEVKELGVLQLMNRFEDKWALVEKVIEAPGLESVVT